MAESPTLQPPKPKSNRGDQGQRRSLKRKRHTTDLAELDAQVLTIDATPSVSFQRFADLPLSEATSSGLEAGHFTTLTDIQRRAIPLALQGRDILGAAKTGSGKTLAFLVPVLENLLRKQWSEHDGLGALILSPTRELAIQIFQVLRKVGRYHTFSAGLVIGGKSLKEERERLGRMNILVCTPGRMLQHLDQTALFESTALQMLVLDEADRILDMGFKNTIDAIVEHLPKERQTLLFSATQTRRVSDLARLNLREPEYVSVHENATESTPSGLRQNYVVVPLSEKLDALWGFLRNNVKKKILVFLSSGKQVRFAHESFRHLQPGVPLMHLHGRQKQGTRLDIVTKFGAARHACLFSTDLAARGLDFPAVDWVLQVDCPEDADTYIHRVGRTARFEKQGNAVLFLDPSEEEGFLKRLKQKNVPIEEIRIRTNKQQSVKAQLQNMCFRDPELKYLGQKAFISYARSIYTQHDKEVFDIQKLQMEEYAASLGLPGTPHLKFQSGVDAKRLKNALRMPVSSDSDDVPDKSKKATPRTRYDRMFERVNQDVLAPHYTNLLEESVAAGSTEAPAEKVESEAEFLTVKRRISDASLGSPPAAPRPTAAPSNPLSSTVRAVDLGPNTEPLLIDSNRRAKLLKSKKALTKFKERGHKLRFDDDGNSHEVYEVQNEAEFRAEGDAKLLRRKFVEKEGQDMQERDAVDKEMQRSKRQARKEKRKEMERAERDGKKSHREDEEEEGMELASLDDDEVVGRDLDMLDWSEHEEHSTGGDLDTTMVEKPGRQTKRKGKKWFQSSSDDEDEPKAPKQNSQRKKSRAKTGVHTLEELEALAEQYM